MKKLLFDEYGLYPPVKYKHQLTIQQESMKITKLLEKAFETKDEYEMLDYILNCRHNLSQNLYKSIKKLMQEIDDPIAYMNTMYTMRALEPSKIKNVPQDMLNDFATCVYKKCYNLVNGNDIAVDFYKNYIDFAHKCDSINGFMHDDMLRDYYIKDVKNCYAKQKKQ